MTLTRIKYSLTRGDLVRRQLSLVWEVGVLRWMLLLGSLVFGWLATRGAEMDSQRLAVRLVAIAIYGVSAVSVRNRKTSCECSPQADRASNRIKRALNA